MKRLWVDPYLGYSLINESELLMVKKVVESHSIFRYHTKKPSFCEEIEKKLSTFLDTPYCRVFANCTLALEAALMSTGGNPGDIVFIPALSFVATATAVLRAGFVPFLVDVDATGHLCPESLRRDIKRVRDLKLNFRSLICVHLDGSGADIEAIQEICRENHLLLIEDCAQSFGVTRGQKYLGTFGDFGCFSFQENKLLTTGEGGMLIATNLELFNRASAALDFGAIRSSAGLPNWEKNFGFGTNAKASELTGALLHSQFEKFQNISLLLKQHSKIMKSFLPSDMFMERHSEDIPLSLWLQGGQEFDSLIKSELPIYSWEHLNLAKHPILLEKRSLYKNGFPWNLAMSMPDWLTPRANEISKRRCLAVPVNINDFEKQLNNLVNCSLKTSVAANMDIIPNDLKPLFIEIPLTLNKPNLVLGGPCICFAKGDPKRISLQDLIDCLIPALIASYNNSDLILYFQSYEAIISKNFLKFDPDKADHKTMKNYLERGIKAVLEHKKLKMPNLIWVDTEEENTKVLIDDWAEKLKRKIPKDFLYSLYGENFQRDYPKGSLDEEDVLAVYYRNLSLYQVEFIEKLLGRSNNLKNSWVICENRGQSRAIRVAGITNDLNSAWHISFLQTPSRQDGKEMNLSNRNHKIELRSSEAQIIERSKSLEDVHSPSFSFYQSIFSGVSINDILNIWKKNCNE